MISELVPSLLEICGTADPTSSQHATIAGRHVPTPLALRAPAAHCAREEIPKGSQDLRPHPKLGLGLKRPSAAAPQHQTGGGNVGRGRGRRWPSGFARAGIDVQGQAWRRHLGVGLALEQPTRMNVLCRPKEGLGAHVEGFGAVSADNRDAEDEVEVARAARWAARWRQLELEALAVARAMTDATSKRYMLFISKSYKLLAERAEARRQRLTAMAKSNPSASPTGATRTSNHPDDAP
jgi:hypothetical protein